MSDDPAPLILSESEALAALFAVAALSGGFVNAICLITDDFPYPRNVGYAVLKGGMLSDLADLAIHSQKWGWRRATRAYGCKLWHAHGFGPGAYPQGRIDRGLGAITPNGNRPGKP